MQLSAISLAITRIGRAGAFSPFSLFSAGEVGAWYDPSDLTTMFQDRAGTTPVTADSQTVGLILDKSKGLVLGPELVTNGDFSNGTTGWTGDASLSVTSGNLTAACASYNTIYPSAYLTTVAGKSYKLVIAVISNNTNTGNIRVGTYSTGNDLYNGSNTLINGAKTYTIIFTALGTATFLWMQSGNAAGTIVFDNISVKEIAGNHAVAPSDAARPLYKTDGTYHWLQFDGVDDSLSTAAIDFTATDASSVFSGVLKNNNTAISIVADFNSAWANQYSFGLAATITAGVAEAGFRSRGTGLSGQSVKSFDISTKAVLTGLGDVSSDVSKIRVNGIEGVSSSDQGTGNYGNGILILGGGAGYYYLPGNIYSLIVRGALSTTDEITETETWVNSKTGAY